MSRLVLIVVLCLSLTAFADTPNRFEPHELSSEAVVTFVLTCSEKVKKSDPSVGEAQRLGFCSCAADALRLRYKQKRKDKAPSAEDLQRCANELTRSSPEEVAGQLQSPPEVSPSEHKVVPASTQPDTSQGADWEDSSSSESPSSVEPARSCCKVCTKGCPCGDSCISCSKVCRKGPGCAC